jgi:hypothetical protein
VPAYLAGKPWIETASLTSQGLLAVTITRDALATEAVRITQAGPACAASTALTGHTVTSHPDPDLASEPDWPTAQAALKQHLIARLATTAGATAKQPAPPSPGPAAKPPGAQTPVAAAINYAGYDSIRFALAHTAPTSPPPNAQAVARHTLSNPAYAVRYAHAAAAAVLRWAASLGSEPRSFRPRLLTAPPELALLDSLSWLPERVAMAARRGRADEFAGYLVELAARTLDTMSTTGFTTISTISTERLWLAAAAQTALATGLALLGVTAPERI